jgi:CRP-like cAMP-binding protein
MTVNALTIWGLSKEAPSGFGDHRGAAFCALPLHHQRVLLEQGVRQALGPGEILFRRDDPARGFYGVVHGTLKVSTLRTDGNEAILAVLGPGDWFGETSLVTGTRREHDVTAIEPTQLMKVDARCFSIMLRDAEFSLAIARLMASRIHRLYAALEDSALKPGPEQIARRLLWLARGDIGGTAKPSTSLRISHETLAMMLGITRQTLAKQLRRLAVAGCIGQKYGRIEITSMARLQKAAAAA